MNLVPRKWLGMVVITVWWLCNSGCSRAQEVKDTSPPLFDKAVSEGQAPLSSLGTPVDVETFLAFCDRA